MPRDRFEDETLSDPLKLLARYRELCERAGGLRAAREPLPGSLQQQLSDLEAELQTRLWLAGHGAGEGKSGRVGVSTGRVLNSPTNSSGSSAKDKTISQGELEILTPSPTPPRSSSPTHLSTGEAQVFADGSCLGNPGPGGYGTIVRLPGQPEKLLSGGKARTTNNEMELTGAIEGLRAAARTGAKEISVISDSEYLVKGMSSWMKGWLRNGWKTRTGGPVKNRELWEELHRLSQGRNVTWQWVEGHAGHPENERCNTLAITAAKRAAGQG